MKEMELLSRGIVKHFDLFDLSSARIAKARSAAREHGLADRINAQEGTPFKTTPPAAYDFVHWNNSLHHMPKASSAVGWSWRSLRDGGVFFMDDYVGATRFQHSERSLCVASLVRKTLPDRYLVDPNDRTRMVPREVTRPDKKALIREDPSEAADSEHILKSVKQYFPDAEITMTGGVIYHLALSDILANIDEAEDAALLEQLLLIDDICTELGETHYATALAFKKERTGRFRKRRAQARGSS
jgi:hypothetical protein